MTPSLPWKFRYEGWISLYSSPLMNLFILSITSLTPKLGREAHRYNGSVPVRSKQPIRTRYLGHVTGYQPIRTRYLGHVTGHQPIRDQYSHQKGSTFALSSQFEAKILSSTAGNMRRASEMIKFSKHQEPTESGNTGL
eukprot:sb/3474465/